MLVKGQKFSLHIFYWLLLVPIFLIISYNNLFFDWQVQYFYFNEIEDFGRYVFILVISFVEAFIYVLVIRLVVFLFQKVLKKNL